MRPDVWCEDDARILLVDSKLSQRVDKKERTYLRFRAETVNSGRDAAFFYAIPEGWAINQGEWINFIRGLTREGHRIGETFSSVKGGLLKWDKWLADFLAKAFNVPVWYRDQLPQSIGTEYL